MYPSHFFSFDTVEYYLKNLVSFAPNGFESTWITISGIDANGAQIKGNWHQENIRGWGISDCKAFIGRFY
ncbi:hypothetical protein [Marivirga harenae]|uniref:hypothetical protein n=1 Tax=Marivirga harenae TaxID=2010992 RepID=UPI0026DFD58B|nr:hypothetical protein [Marivirga harenae]WKV10583.1 hypothetical protein Q3Y49_10190 [Marivirga harenae]